MFPCTTVKKRPREVSYHNPLIILVMSKIPMRYFQFRFELSWLNDPNFFVQVERILTKHCKAKSTLDKIQQKLMLLKQYYEGCGFNLQGELRKQRKELQEELINLETLEESANLFNERWWRKSWLLSESLRLLEQEELYVLV